VLTKQLEDLVARLKAVEDRVITIDYEQIVAQIKNEISIEQQPVTIEIYDDIDNDGNYRDGDRLIPVPTSSGGNPGQEVFRIMAVPPDPLRIRVEGLLNAR
jgi:hypothetical protein